MPSFDDPDATRAQDAVATLLTRTLDALEGYRVMVDKAEPGFRPVAEQFRALHAAHAEALAALLHRLGRTPDLGGSFMGTLDKAVVTLSAVFGTIDRHDMTHIRSGERTVLDGFERALAASLPAAERDRVLAMQADLTALLDRTRDLG